MAQQGVIRTVAQRETDLAHPARRGWPHGGLAVQLGQPFVVGESGNAKVPLRHALDAEQPLFAPVWIFNSWLTSAVINAVLPLRLRPVTARRKCRSTPRLTSAFNSVFSRFIASPLCPEGMSRHHKLSAGDKQDNVNPFAPSPRRHYFIPRVTRLASRLSSGSSATASSIFSGRRATDLTA